MRIVFLYSIIFFPCILFGQSTNVLFGERDLKDARFAVYIDKEGSPYPDYFISNTSLEKNNASLINWYAKNQNDFFAVSKQYNCLFDKYSQENCSILNDSIVASIKRKINDKKVESNSVSFLIHGYRKPFVKANGDRTSPRDYGIMEESINKNVKTLCVEVYWDAMYDCCYSTNRKKNKALYALLEEADRNAEPVGHSLRSIINNLQYDTVNIITHSLGAKVALHTLFNVAKSHVPTPENKRVNICLIAPALSDDSFIQYYERQTTYDFKTKDNYKLILLFNENDFVLRKKVGWFGPGPNKYVNTTLGCNHKGCTTNFEVDFLKKFTNSSLQLIDMSFVGQCHLVGCYFSSGNMDGLFESIKH